MIKSLALLLFGCTMAAAQHSVTLTWSWSQGTGSPATNFVASRSTTTGGPYTTTVCNVPVATLTCIDTTDLIEGTTYYYIVVATGPGGNSSPSNEAKGTIPFLPPNSPSLLQAVPK